MDVFILLLSTLQALCIEQIQTFSAKNYNLYTQFLHILDTPNVFQLQNNLAEINRFINSKVERVDCMVFFMYSNQVIFTYQRINCRLNCIRHDFISDVCFSNWTNLAQKSLLRTSTDINS